MDKQLEKNIWFILNFSADMPKFYREKPDGFIPSVEVSIVFMEYDGKLLLLYRARNEHAPNTWCIPGGKLEKGETPLEGLLREIDEELQLKPNVDELTHHCSPFVQHPLVNYQLHLFHWTLTALPTIVLNPQEHTDFIWQPIEQFADLHLLEGQLEAFRMIYRS